MSRKKYKKPQRRTESDESGTGAESEAEEEPRGAASFATSEDMSALHDLEDSIVSADSDSQHNKPIRKMRNATPQRQLRKRPGAKAIKEIIKYQKSTEHLIKKFPFTELVREIASKISPRQRYRFSLEAMMALLEASEAHLVTLFSNAHLCAVHARRITIMKRDIQLVRQLLNCMSRSNSANFLAVPLKTTSEVDLVKPLTTYIDSVYNTTDDNKPEITEAIQELNKLRTKAVCQPLDKHQSALDVLTRYYDQLAAIESKIIISATQNPVVFKWKDAFDKGGLFSSKASLSIADGSFERACVLYNIGALMSQIAANQMLVTDEEMKTAAKLYQQAAGVFAQLRDTVLGLVQQDPTSDLLPDTLAALSMLMTAQAQESFYIKANKDKMKSAILSKLATQVGLFYAEAAKLMAKDTVKGLWEKEWMLHVNGKSMGYAAMGQLHQAEVDGENHKVGDQLSRLAEAIKMTEQCSKYLAPGFLEESLKVLPKVYAAAKKDNDFIYHERVADFRSLAALQGAAVAKPSPPTNPMSPRFKDMFINLVPVQVLNAMQSYQGRKSEIVNIESGRLREHTQLMNGLLASLNLPAAIEDVTSSDTLPESIKEKSAKVKQSGGRDELTRLINELPELYKRNEEILNETHRMLTEEKESDDKLRAQFGTRWSRMSSDQLTAPLVQEVGKYRGILHTASGADKMVRDKFEANLPGILLLSKSENELKGSIPGQQAHTTGGVTESVEKLRQLMQQVQQIKTDREKLEKELKDVNCDLTNDFLKAMAESQILNEEAISKEKIAQIYGPLKERVNSSIKQQEDVMADVETWNNKFVAEKRGTDTGAERENTLKLLATGFDAFNELKNNLEEGTKFYNDLTPILVRLQQKVSDFVFARQTEKEDLMRQVQQNIVSGGSAAPAPPRPPPPRPAEPAAAPVAPPRTQASLQDGPTAPGVPPQPFPGQLPYYQQAVPYGQPQPMFYQPQYQPNFANPYMTFPGAFPNYQQPYGNFPMQPNPYAPTAPGAPNPFQQPPAPPQ